VSVPAFGDWLAALAAQHVRRRAVPAHAPQLGLGHPGRGQGLERGADVFHARGALHDPLGLGGRKKYRIEARGHAGQRLLQLPELRAHGHRLDKAGQFEHESLATATETPPQRKMPRR
jgi:hypothetical protein